MIEQFKLYKLEFVVLLGGATGMMLELVGSRVIAPYFGNSLIVWTSLIGVVLGCLSLGYHYGGKLADKTHSFDVLANILLLASVFTGLTAFLKEIILNVIMFSSGGEIRSASFMAVLLMFGPTSVLLGMITPFAAKLKLNDIGSSGRVMGNVYALSTLGSILGTFLAGFVLIPAYGNSSLLYGLSLLLVVVSIVAVLEIRSMHLMLIVCLALMFYLNQFLGLFKLDTVADVDSLYNRIIVREMTDIDGVKIRTISTDNAGIQSAVIIEKPQELYSAYARAYRLVDRINPNVKSALMIGGGGYIFPRDFLQSHPEGVMDVIEIDPKMTELAKKHFFLVDSQRLNIFHEDARLFINKNSNEYDVIFLDAFNALTPPPHLTTREFMSDLKKRLTDKGYLMINLISAVTGDKSEFLLSQTATVLSVFEEIDIFVLKDYPPTEIQNILLVAYSSKETSKFEIDEIEAMQETSLRLTGESKSRFLANLQYGKMLTDDHNPVEYMTRKFYSF